MAVGDRHPGPADPRFFGHAGPWRADALAELVGATLVPPRAAGPASVTGAAGPMLTGIAPLQTAGAAQVAFLDNRKYLAELEATGAGVVVLAEAHAGRRPDTAWALVTDAPYLAWARIAARFHPAPLVTPGVHPSAVVADASVDPTAEIAAFAYVGPGASIGAGTRIDEHAVIGPGVVVGRDGRIGAQASVTHAILGDRVRIYAGARIGQDGFGFAVGPSGFETVPQLGRVLIGDDVEIGANSTIDRGSVTDTVIGAGSRLDNLVQIGHNVRLGRCCVVVAQAGISGSTTLDDFVTVAAQAGLTGHLRIGTKARIGAQAGVMSDVGAGLDVVGSPAMAVREFFRNVATLRRLSRRGGAGS